MKLKPSKSIQLAKARADKYFSQYIRERDKDKPCITCGKFGKKDCGHFISRRFSATRYHEKNSAGQCWKCNRFEYGNQYAYSEAVDKLYGEGTAKKLLELSRMMCKRSRFDYDYIAQEFKDKIELLKLLPDEN